MPEGHVIHYLAERLNTAFAGQKVAVSSPQGVFSSQASCLDGAVFDHATAWGKHLFVLFSSSSFPDATVHIHLGLIGKLNIHSAEQPAEGVVRLEISDEHTRAHLHGPQWCRLITRAEMDQTIEKLGPDPLHVEYSTGHTQQLNRQKLQKTRQKIMRSRRSIASLLMDQSLYAGVGNIYRAEVLFLHNIDPLTSGKDLSEQQFYDIWEDLVRLMEQGARSGRIDTVAPEHTPEAMGRPPRRDDHGGEVYVYRRAGQSCYVCSTIIEVESLEGRNLFWCPSCQPSNVR